MRNRRGIELDAFGDNDKGKLSGVWEGSWIISLSIIENLAALMKSQNGWWNHPEDHIYKKTFF